MNAALVAGLLAGYGVAIPVGAVATYLVTLSARTSLCVGLAAALGVATADGIYALLAVLGGAALSAAITVAAGPLRWASAVVLLVLAARTAASALRRHRLRGGREEAPPGTGAAEAYVRLLSVTLVNPTTVVYFAALVAGVRAGASVSLSEQLVFVLAAFSASASWQVLLASSGALLGRALTGPRARLATALISSAVIAALALKLTVT